MAKSPEDAKATMIAGLKEKTGKSLPEWLKLVNASEAAKHKEIVTFLKTDHGLTHGYANMIALQALGSDSHTAGKTDDLVEAQFAGPKAALRPVYEAILAAVAGFGKDIEVSPKKAYVSLRRTKQFALVQPSTAKRLDVGLILPSAAVPKAAGERLEESGSFNAMMTHRVRLATVEEVDAELVAWLRRAYDGA